MQSEKTAYELLAEMQCGLFLMKVCVVALFILAIVKAWISWKQYKRLK